MWSYLWRLRFQSSHLLLWGKSQGVRSLPTCAAILELCFYGLAEARPRLLESVMLARMKSRNARNTGRTGRHVLLISLRMMELLGMLMIIEKKGKDKNLQFFLVCFSLSLREWELEAAVLMIFCFSVSRLWQIYPEGNWLWMTLPNWQ